MKGTCKNNLTSTLMIYFKSINMVLGKAMGLRIVLVMTEKLRKIRDKKGIFGAVLRDLSKAFECIPHYLLRVEKSCYVLIENNY